MTIQSFFFFPCLGRLSFKKRQTQTINTKTHAHWFTHSLILSGCNHRTSLTYSSFEQNVQHWWAKPSCATRMSEKKHQTICSFRVPWHSVRWTDEPIRSTETVFKEYIIEVKLLINREIISIFFFKIHFGIFLYLGWIHFRGKISNIPFLSNKNNFKKMLHNLL